MSKTLGFWKHPLRDWQRAAQEKLDDKVENNLKDFLAVATPAAGKTRFALRAAHKWLFTHRATRIVVVVPTEHLKRQWAIDAAKYGIQLEPNLPNRLGRETADYHGSALTYSQLGINPIVHKNAIDGIETFVIMDEIHHAGDSKTWGDAVQLSFDNAAFRLSLSGTPFRRDNNPIPFVTYEDNVSKADYVYNYTSAIEDKICRPIYFPAYDGQMEWKVDGKTYKHSFTDNIDDVRSSERLRTALDTEGEFLTTLLKDADKQLNEIRQTHPDAGGLVLAMDQSHVNAIAKKMLRLTGEYPVIATYDDPEASAKIKEFRNGQQKWIICVRMISEGVDIPRLRVGVYATNIRSELFFRQVVGRFVRIIANLFEQKAYLFIPKDPDILKFARQIEQERDHALNKAKDDYGDGRTIRALTATEENHKEFEPIRSVVTDTEQLQLAFNDKISRMFHLGKENTGRIINGMAKSEIEREEDTPAVFERKRLLRDEINILAKVYAKNRGNGTIDWEIGHKDWIARGGKPIDKETEHELILRRNFLRDKA